MIVDDLNVMSATVTPDEADSPWVVDPYAVLSLSVARESFQAVSRRNAEVFNAGTAIQHAQLPKGGLLNIRRQPSRVLALEDPLGLPAPEALYHGNNI
jgi:hypothetical protein